MTASAQHGNLDTWVGLAVGLALAWGGWTWWCRWTEANRWTWFDEGSSPAAIRMRDSFWFEEGWVQPLIIAALVIFALLCAVAGAMIGRRWPAEIHRTD